MHNKPSHGGGLAAWSIRHPIGVTMIALAMVILGLFSLGRLSIDLLPRLIYPEIRIRVLEPGVPATVMEDRITRQLEEQLAITEDAISVQSRTGEGSTQVDLSFEYGKDIDIALRDASMRLDRAKRFLPTTIEPVIIYKRDPSQIPVAEFVVSSPLKDPVELRSWVDDVFRNWFLNLPGVASAEVGGGLQREIQILPDQERLASMGLKMQDLIQALQQGNLDDPAGRLQMDRREISSRISGRFSSVEAIAKLPIALSDGNTIHLSEVAQVIDTHEDERLRVRLNGIPGIKVSIQKQPNANTVSVVEEVNKRLQWLQRQGLLSEDIQVLNVADQSLYIKQALNNSSRAAISGALLAMAVVYLFLGNLRHTLIIGSAIPIAILVTFIIMGLGGLTLNIMTLGGLALGVGMLVDSTIVMLENIYRHQHEGEGDFEAGTHAAMEVNSAIVASTSTNLAAVLPFLFIGGLFGLLFRELVYTISAAIFASMVIALTLVPAMATRVHVTARNRLRYAVDGLMSTLNRHYQTLLHYFLNLKWLLIAVLVLLLIFPIYLFILTENKLVILPKLDDGRISISLLADPGTTLEEMDQYVTKVEGVINEQAGVDRVFTLAGGFIFGRTEREIPNRSTLTVQLVPRSQRDFSSNDWVNKMTKAIGKQRLSGLRVRIRTRGVHGLRTGRGDDDISIRIQGPDLKTLERLGDDIVLRLRDINGLRNVLHSSEEKRQELSIEIDRERAATLGLNVEDVGRAVRIALQGIVVTDYIDGDRAYNIRLRLPQVQMTTPQDMESILLFPASRDRAHVYLGNVAEVRIIESPAKILRDNQQRIIEVSGSVSDDTTLGAVMLQIDEQLTDLQLPPEYSYYEGGNRQTLQQGRQLTSVLLFLAVFLVFVVMAVQYESLRNPIIIMLSVPFAAIGVAIGLSISGLPISMPVWLGMIMLAGIVVNNAIVLVEYIEIVRSQGRELKEAIIEAAGLRLRPILMTTLTTAVGMAPLALGIGEGAEMLQPLAVTIVFGLTFSMLVTLGLIPAVYHALQDTHTQ
ncbi:MAG: efflux RND transporter permease subunit [Gammaproteobacteria bacterium]|nr:MAG: efflux RND transporter permease subunit [Gammaproteobacteria bacterium]